MPVAGVSNNSPSDGPPGLSRNRQLWRQRNAPRCKLRMDKAVSVGSETTYWVLARKRTLGRTMSDEIRFSSVFGAGSRPARRFASMRPAGTNSTDLVTHVSRFRIYCFGSMDE